MLYKNMVKKVNLIYQSILLIINSDFIQYYNGNVSDPCTGSLLFHSLYRGDLESFKKLISIGADLNYKYNINIY